MCFDTIEARGFSPRATAIAARTVATCYMQCFHQDNRPLIGLALFSVIPDGEAYRFETQARALRHDELPDILLDWLEPRIPEEGALLSWDHWQTLPVKLSSLAHDHPAIATAALETEGRWRDLPRSYSWHLKQAVAQSMPCLCAPRDPAPCVQRLPAALLPDPDLTEATLIDEAARGWVTWARQFGAFDDAEHPVRRALAAYQAWSASPGSPEA